MTVEYDRMVQQLQRAGHDVGAAAPKPRSRTTRQLIRAEIDKVVDGFLTKAIAQAIATMVNESEQRLEAKIGKLASAQLKAAGPWTPGQTYRSGDIVGCGGSAFVCTNGTSAKPGTSPDWCLLASRGRDGADAPRPQRTTPSHRSAPPTPQPSRSNP